MSADGPGPNPYAPPDAPVTPNARRPAPEYTDARRASDRRVGGFWLVFGGFWLGLGINSTLREDGSVFPVLALLPGLPLTALGYYLVRGSFRGRPAGLDNEDLSIPD